MDQTPLVTTVQQLQRLLKKETHGKGGRGGPRHVAYFLTCHISYDPTTAKSLLIYGHTLATRSLSVHDIESGNR